MRRGRKFLDLKGMVGIIGAFADVAELADAQASGACGGNPVEVRLLSSAFPCGRREVDCPSPGRRASLLFTHGEGRTFDRPTEAARSVLFTPLPHPGRYLG